MVRAISQKFPRYCSMEIMASSDKSPQRKGNEDCGIFICEMIASKTYVRRLMGPLASNAVFRRT